MIRYQVPKEETALNLSNVSEQVYLVPFLCTEMQSFHQEPLRAIP